MDTKRVVLCGGGIDTVLSAATYPDAIKVYFDLGHLYATEEKRALLSMYPDVVIDTSLRGLGQTEDSDAFIPNRNVFLFLAALKYGNKIIIGTTIDDNVHDQDVDVFRSFEDLALKLGYKNVVIETPFLDLKMGKIEAVKKFVGDTEFDINMKKCFSCFTPVHLKPCQKCAACFRKNVVIHAVYDNSDKFKNLKLANEYKIRCLDGVYDEVRKESTLLYIATI